MTGTRKILLVVALFSQVDAKCGCPDEERCVYIGTVETSFLGMFNRTTKNAGQMCYFGDGLTERCECKSPGHVKDMCDENVSTILCESYCVSNEPSPRGQRDKLLMNNVLGGPVLGGGKKLSEMSMKEIKALAVFPDIINKDSEDCKRLEGILYSDAQSTKFYPQASIKEIKDAGSDLAKLAITDVKASVGRAACGNWILDGKKSEIIRELTESLIRRSVSAAPNLFVAKVITKLQQEMCKSLVVSGHKNYVVQAGLKLENADIKPHFQTLALNKYDTFPNLNLSTVKINEAERSCQNWIDQCDREGVQKMLEEMEDGGDHKKLLQATNEICKALIINDQGKVVTDLLNNTNLGPIIGQYTKPLNFKQKVITESSLESAKNSCQKWTLNCDKASVQKMMNELKTIGNNADELDYYVNMLTEERNEKDGHNVNYYANMLTKQHLEVTLEVATALNTEDVDKILKRIQISKNEDVLHDQIRQLAEFKKKNLRSEAEAKEEEDDNALPNQKTQVHSLEEEDVTKSEDS